MRKLIILCTVLFATLIIILSFKDSHVPIRLFRRTGEVPLGGSRIFSDTITPTTGNGFSIDISAAGFTETPRVQVNPMRNTATATSVPNIALKSVSITAVVVNITEGNPATTTILGIPVLSGAPIIFVADPSNIVLHVIATGK